MNNCMSKIWRPKKGVMITEAEGGVSFFNFQFFHKLDMQRVMDDGQWLIDSQLLILGRLEEGV